MNGLPAPPARLPPDPPILALPPGLRLLRFYKPARGKWPTQRAYGPVADMRFDHHPPPCRLHVDRSVWYSATSLRGAVAESFGREASIKRGARLRVVMATVRKQLRVLDLVGVAARSLGLTQEIAATTDCHACQEWARALYDHYPQAHGIRWRGRQSGSVCVVLHDRAEMARLEGESWSLTDPEVWPRIARAARDCRLTVV